MFDIQRFGYNDTVTSAQTLQIEFGFEDEDTRSINVPNPKEEITSEEVGALSYWIEGANIVIGDKTGAASSGINAATRVTKTTTKLDLS